MKTKIKSNDKIEISVVKTIKQNNKQKTLYHLLTTYKYIDCLLLNLFNFPEQSINAVKMCLKSNGVFSLSYTRHGENSTSSFDKTLTIELK